MFEFERIQELKPNNELLKQNFYADGIINCPYIENENIVDYLTLLPKIPLEFL